ncbi:hypothetical protein R3P38DRAFT_2695120 [Favolaschia claudopus]|uniref:Uncharacterized protein n=1 Tax=Favolaschia claudopus TaxID=2862362 RepID=A0AAW0CJJ0_9AGAR
MTPLARSIIEFAIPAGREKRPGIRDKVRNCLEWTWGLGHAGLDVHLQEFADPDNIVMDDTLLAFLPNNTFYKLSLYDSQARAGCRRPHIQQIYEGCKTFEYLVVPIDRTSTVPTRLLTSEVPPRVALCASYGKIIKHWGHLPGRDLDIERALLVERANATVYDGRLPLSMIQLDKLQFLHASWSVAAIPPSFYSGDSDQTMVEPEATSPAKNKRKSTTSSVDWDVMSSVSHRQPKRRLLPYELETPFDQVSIETSFDDEDSIISDDSHISGIEDDPEAFVVGSAARGDYDVDRKWLKKIQHWASKASSKARAKEKLLFNDGQIGEYRSERPREATSLDLSKPDYLSRHLRRAVS